ncbi:MAG TPA: hypothetical protein VK449_12675, partial [Anaerolineales bacterium]|nr:hypothetical protein [Anaerolineales bacterium]
ARETRRAGLTPAPKGRDERPARKRRDRRAADLTQLETRIEMLEQTLRTLAEAMDQARGDAARVTSLGSEYAERERELELLLESWAQAAADTPG